MLQRNWPKKWDNRAPVFVCVIWHSMKQKGLRHMNQCFRLVVFVVSALFTTTLKWIFIFILLSAGKHCSALMKTSHPSTQSLLMMKYLSGFSPLPIQSAPICQLYPFKAAIKTKILSKTYFLFDGSWGQTETWILPSPARVVCEQSHLSTATAMYSVVGNRSPNFVNDERLRLSFHFCLCSPPKSIDCIQVLIWLIRLDVSIRT